MSSNVKINGVNMFINKLDFKDKQVEIINLDTLKTNFELDDGDTGFYKLSLYKKNVYDDGTITENYNRPGIGPIQDGTYCSICQRLGGSNHANNCDRPRDESLYLTLGGFRDYILNDPGYSGDYSDIKESFIKTNNFEQVFYPKVIKKYKTKLFKINGFWHSIDNIKDIEAIDKKSKKNNKYLKLKKLKVLLDKR